MDASDYPEDERPGATGKVPSLIHDYRAQRDVWREQARNLARMREEVLAAADSEAKEIVTTARTDIRSILLKARRDLLVLAAQVRAAGRLGDAEDATDVTFLPGDELGQASNTLTSARHDIRRVLDESRPELEGLASEGEALRAALRQQRPNAPTAIEPRRRLAAAPIQDIPARPYAEAAVDFEFATSGADEWPDLTIRKRPSIRTLITAAATLGGIALMGTTWWLFRPHPDTTKSPAVDVKTAAAVTTGPSSAKLTATERAAPAAARTATDRGFRGSPIPDSRSPLTIGLSARRTAWIRVTTDGRVTAERIFRAGETQSISAAREVSVRAGDAGAVMVSVGGRQPVALGPEGEAVTRRFAAEGPRGEPSVPARPTPSPSSPAVPVAGNATERRPAAAAIASPTTAAASNPPRITTQQPVTSTTASSPVVPPTAAPAPARPAAASVDRPAAATTPPPPGNQPSLQDSLTNSASRWLDAYYRQDRAMMASISGQVSISDDRGDKERLPRGLNGVRRQLQDVNLQVAGSEAVLTARMTERMDNAAAGQMAETVSYVSHMWSQRNGTWQLHDVRIVSASTLGRALR